MFMGNLTHYRVKAANDPPPFFFPYPTLKPPQPPPPLFLNQEMSDDDSPPIVRDPQNNAAATLCCEGNDVGALPVPSGMNTPARSPENKRHVSINVTGSSEAFATPTNESDEKTALRRRIETLEQQFTATLSRRTPTPQGHWASVAPLEAIYAVSTQPTLRSSRKCIEGTPAVSPSRHTQRLRDCMVALSTHARGQGSFDNILSLRKVELAALLDEKEALEKKLSLLTQDLTPHVESKNDADAVEGKFRSQLNGLRRQNKAIDAVTRALEKEEIAIHQDIQDLTIALQQVRRHRGASELALLRELNAVSRRLRELQDALRRMDEQYRQSTHEKRQHVKNIRREVLRFNPQEFLAERAAESALEPAPTVRGRSHSVIPFPLSRSTAGKLEETRAEFEEFLSGAE